MPGLAKTAGRLTNNPDAKTPKKLTLLPQQNPEEINITATTKPLSAQSGTLLLIPTFFDPPLHSLVPALRTAYTPAANTVANHRTESRRNTFGV